jgi:hypothetical protein
MMGALGFVLLIALTALLASAIGMRPAGAPRAPDDPAP